MEQMHVTRTGQFSFDNSRGMVEIIRLVDGARHVWSGNAASEIARAAWSAVYGVNLKWSERESAFSRFCESRIDSAIRANADLTGRAAYEASLEACPLYHDGTPRKQWADLCPVAQWSWNRPPRLK